MCTCICFQNGFRMFFHVFLLYIKLALTQKTSSFTSLSYGFKNESKLGLVSVTFFANFCNRLVENRSANND